MNPKFFRFASLFLIVAFVLAACQTGQIPETGGGAASDPTEPPLVVAQDATPTTAAAAEAEINVVSDPELGEILVGNNGMTLYMFTVDEPNVSNCDADCLGNWPPLVTQGNPVLGPGVDPALVSSTTTTDGRQIVTYNGMPLYYWVNDTQPGDTTGQGVGDVWFVVNPQGEPVGAPAPQQDTTPTQAAAAGEAEISVVNDPLHGEILVGANGMTLYLFTRDEPNVSNCAGDCLVNWPPLVTEGNPVLGEGVDPALVSSTSTTDGRQIVTYNGWPLYYWINDTQPGDTTGQGVGGVWYVVNPQGEPVGAEGQTTTPQTPAADDAEINVATHPEYGEILVGKDGLTLYIFTNDEPNVSNCTGDCLMNWPPLVTQGNPTLGPGVDPTLVGTAELEDGRQIVTYNDMPLYYWVNDTEAGQAGGQGRGDVWFVITPEGEIVQQEPTY